MAEREAKKPQTKSKNTKTSNGSAKKTTRPRSASPERAAASPSVLANPVALLPDGIPGFVFRQIVRPDGDIEFPYVSPSISNVAGVDADDVVSRASEFLDSLHPDDLDVYVSLFRPDAPTPEPVSVDVRFCPSYIDHVWLRIHASPRVLEDGVLQWDGMAIDVTASYGAEEEERSVGAHYREMIDQLPDAVYVQQEGRVIFANDAACRMFGAKSVDDLLGRSTLDLFASEMHEEVLARRKQHEEEPLPVLDARHIRLDGSSFFGATVGRRIDWNGEPAILVLIHDITERKQAERLHETARQAAEDANRAKSDFLASMSHELRTPLNGVLGTANLLLDGTLTGEQHERVEIIRQSGGSLLSLLNDILDISKVESGRLELEDIDFDLDVVLSTVADLWGPQIEAKGLRFVRDDSDMPFPILRSDPARIRQILFNVISNALKFTEQGSITLKLTQKPKGTGFAETTLEVIDTGAGIPPDRVGRIFEKFVQADNSITRRYGGSGLGLALCKSFAAALNGNIGVKSKLGEGSTFWFRIICPIGDAEKVQEAIREESVDNMGGDRTVRILVAEDNKINQTVIIAMLEKAGHHVDVVNNGLEAVSAVMRTPYDVILMDVQMPEMDGITATKKIRSLDGERGDMPIIALTANAMVGDREQYLEAGMTDYVSKPIEPAKLAAALRRQCGSDVAVSINRPGAPAPTVAEPAEPDASLQSDLDKLFEQM